MKLSLFSSSSYYLKFLLQILLLLCIMGFGSIFPQDDYIRVWTDKETYSPGEIVTISYLSVYMGVPNGGDHVRIEVFNPGGRKVFSKDTVADANGRGGASFQLSSDAMEGTYNVKATSLDTHIEGTTKFEVSAAAIGIFLKMDKDKAIVGEEVRAYGYLTQRCRCMVMLEIISPEGNPLILQEYTNILGNFSFTFTPNSTGLWSIKAKTEECCGYKGGESSTLTLLVKLHYSNITLNLSNGSYPIGYKLPISGFLNPPLPGETVELRIMYRRTLDFAPIYIGQEIETSRNGNFSFLYTLEEGFYIIWVEWSGNEDCFGAVSKPIQIRVANLPDLIITDVKIMPSCPVAGSVISSLAVTVKNVGAVKAEGFYVFAQVSPYLLKRGEELRQYVWYTSSVSVTGYEQAPPILEPGNETTIYLWAQGVPSSSYIIPRVSQLIFNVTADYPNYVNELDETNNNYTAVFEVKVTYPDLVIRYCDQIWISENTMILLADVSNMGEGAVGLTSPEDVMVEASYGNVHLPLNVSFSTRIYQHPETHRVALILHTSQAEGSDITTARLIVGSSISKICNVPRLPRDGEMVMFSVDPYNRVPESDENNNICSFRVKQIISPYPNLVLLPSDFATSISQEDGLRVLVKGRVRNLGLKNVESEFTIRATLKSESNIIEEEQTSPPLRIGAASAFSFSLPVEEEGTYLLEISADPYNHITESNESDNLVSLTVEVNLPDLTIELTGWVGDISPGGGVYFNYKITNIGEFWSPPPGSSIYVKSYINIGEREYLSTVDALSYDLYNGSQVWSGGVWIELPNLYASEYEGLQVNLVVNPTQVVPESNYKNNFFQSTLEVEPDLPDLEVEIFQVPPMRTGEEGFVILRVYNRGSENFVGSYVLHFKFGGLEKEIERETILYGSSIGWGDFDSLVVTISKDDWKEVLEEKHDLIIVNVTTNVLEATKENNIDIFEIGVKPDLVPRFLLPDNIWLSSLNTISFLVENRGNASAGPFRILLNITVGDTVTSYDFYLSGLPICGSQIYTVQFQAPNLLVSYATVGIYVDYEDDVEELIEDNNLLELNLSASPNLSPLVELHPSGALSIKWNDSFVNVTCTPRSYMIYGYAEAYVYADTSLNLTIAAQDLDGVIESLILCLDGWKQFTYRPTPRESLVIFSREYRFSEGTHQLLLIAKDQHGAEGYYLLILHAIRKPEIEIQGLQLTSPLNFFSPYPEFRSMHLYGVIRNTGSENVNISILIIDRSWGGNGRYIGNYTIQGGGEISLSEEIEYSNLVLNGYLWFLTYMEDPERWIPVYEQPSDLPISSEIEVQVLTYCEVEGDVSPVPIYVERFKIDPGGESLVIDGENSIVRVVIDRDFDNRVSMGEEHNITLRIMKPSNVIPTAVTIWELSSSGLSNFGEAEITEVGDTYFEVFANMSVLGELGMTESWVSIYAVVNWEDVNTGNTYTSYTSNRLQEFFYGYEPPLKIVDVTHSYVSPAVVNVRNDVDSSVKTYWCLVHRVIKLVWNGFGTPTVFVRPEMMKIYSVPNTELDKKYPAVFKQPSIVVEKICEDGGESSTKRISDLTYETGLGWGIKIGMNCTSRNLPTVYVHYLLDGVPMINLPSLDFFIIDENGVATYMGTYVSDVAPYCYYAENLVYASPNWATRLFGFNFNNPPLVGSYGGHCCAMSELSSYCFRRGIATSVIPYSYIKGFLTDLQYTSTVLSFGFGNPCVTPPIHQPQNREIESICTWIERGELVCMQIQYPEGGHTVLISGFYEATEAPQYGTEWIVLIGYDPNIEVSLSWPHEDSQFGGIFIYPPMKDYILSYSGSECYITNFFLPKNWEGKWVDWWRDRWAQTPSLYPIELEKWRLATVQVIRVRG